MGQPIHWSVIPKDLDASLIGILPSPKKTGLHYELKPLGWNRMGWDGMRWDGMKWDGIEWDRITVHQKGISLFTG